MVQYQRSDLITSPHGSFISSDANFNALIGKDTNQTKINFEIDLRLSPSISSVEIYIFSPFFLSLMAAAAPDEF